jgi:hypothetical protein
MVAAGQGIAMLLACGYAMFEVRTKPSTHAPVAWANHFGPREIDSSLSDLHTSVLNQ